MLKSNGTLAANGTLYWYMTPGVVAETDLAGTLKSEYVFFDGERVVRKDSPGNTLAYYFSDNLKTGSVITDAAGNIKAESDYYPWGGELQFVNNDSNDYKFTGKKRDTETGLDYFGARYYSNATGRFINADPILFEAGRAFEPQKLNLYGYAVGNPLRFVDPTGNASIDAGLLSRVNNLRQTTTQVALTEVAAYRSGNSGTGNYSARGTYWLHEAASAQQNLEEHADLQGLWDPQGQYDNALAGLVGYLEPQVQQGLLDELSNWANDPNTTVGDLKAAMYDIARADGLEVPEPNAGNRQLKELARTSWEKVLDELTDILVSMHRWQRKLLKLPFKLRMLTTKCAKQGSQDLEEHKITKRNKSLPTDRNAERAVMARKPGVLASINNLCRVGTAKPTPK